MSDNFRRIDTNLIYPPLLVLAQKLVTACEARGASYWAISGYRSPEEQNQLYAQGRTLPGPIVTKARGGQSAHNFQVAIDFCFDREMRREGLQPGWEAESYRILAEEAVKLGLEPGFNWKFKDAPHIQLPLGRAGVTLQQLLVAYNGGGIAATRNLLNRYRW